MEYTYKELGTACKKLVLDVINEKEVGVIDFSHEETLIYLNKGGIPFVFKLTIDEDRSNDTIKGLLKYEYSGQNSFCGAFKFTQDEKELLKEINSKLVQLNKKRMTSFFVENNLI